MQRIITCILFTAMLLSCLCACDLTNPVPTASTELPTESVPVKYQILYAKVDVIAGQKMTAENIDYFFEARTTTDANIAQQGIPYSERRSVLEGVYTQRNIYKGQLVTISDFSKVNKIYNDIVPEGKTLIAIDIPPLTNESAAPKAGDIIGIYHIPQNGEVSHAEIYPYLQYVQVQKVVSNTITDISNTTHPAFSFVLAVNQGEQARQLVEAAYLGNDYFAIVSSEDNAKAQELLALQDEIIFNSSE